MLTKSPCCLERCIELLLLSFQVGNFLKTMFENNKIQNRLLFMRWKDERSQTETKRRENLKGWLVNGNGYIHDVPFYPFPTAPKRRAETGKKNIYQDCAGCWLVWMFRGHELPGTSCFPWQQHSPVSACSPST